MPNNKNWAITIVGDCRSAEIQVFGKAPKSAVKSFKLMFEPVCANLKIKHYPALTDEGLAQLRERRYELQRKKSY